MAKKYDRALIEEVQARKDEEDKIKSKWLYSIVCNHIVYPHLLGLSGQVHRMRINKQPPPKMDGYVYLCDSCLPYLQNMNAKVAKECFSMRHESEFMKNIEFGVRVAGVKLKV